MAGPDSHSAAFDCLRLLREAREYEKRHLQFLQTVEDLDLLIAIGMRQREQPMTLKELLLAGVASVATVQRRLRRLRELGVVQQQRCHHDARVVQVTLNPRVLRMFEKYALILKGAS